MGSSDKRIYHYTSIAAFKSILETGCLRLSRLDTVDDPEERQPAANGVDPSMYVFVSSWTRDKREMLPQWKMYGASYHGVRISLPEDCLEMVSKGQFFYPKSVPDRQNLESVIVGNRQKAFLHDIKYVSNPQGKINSMFGDIDVKSMMVTDPSLGFRINEVCLYKHETWQFQKECRFSVAAYPRVTAKGPDDEMYKLIKHPNYIFSEKVPNSIEFFDVVIKKSALRELEVVFGPCVTDDERNDVLSHISHFLKTKREIHIPDSKISNSAFTGMVREPHYLGPERYFKDPYGNVFRLVTSGRMLQDMANVVVLQEISSKDGSVWVLPALCLDVQTTMGVVFQDGVAVPKYKEISLAEVKLLMRNKKF